MSNGESRETSAVYDEVVAANAAYASGFDKGDLALPPARGFAILTCMGFVVDGNGWDARLTSAFQSIGIRPVGNHGHDACRIAGLRAGIDQALQVRAAPGDEDCNGCLGAHFAVRWPIIAAVSPASRRAASTASASSAATAAIMQLGYAIRLGGALSGGSAGVLKFFTLRREGGELVLSMQEGREDLVVERARSRFESLAEILGLKAVLRTDTR